MNGGGLDAGLSNGWISSPHFAIARLCDEKVGKSASRNFADTRNYCSSMVILEILRVGKH
jgi:hypothetical protein